MLSPPKILADRYRLDAALGDDGTYRGTQLALGREVVVKVLAPDADADAAGRFLREARLHGLLTCEHTVRVIDFGVDEGGQRYLVTEACEGETLRERLDRLGRLPADTAIDVTTQILRALVEAHRKGVVHRDLKPEHIRFAQSGDREVVKVLDFGIAKHLDAADNVLETRNGLVVGTPQYMSPEQVTGDAVRASTDLYAVGVVMYEMLTGAPPFDGDSAAEVMARHVEEDPIAPSEACPLAHIPALLDAFVMRALEKEPALRARTAEAMADDLASVVRDTEAAVARRAAANVDTVRTPRGIGRTRVLVAACAAAACMLAVGVAVLARSSEGAAPVVIDARPPRTFEPPPSAIVASAADTVPVAALPDAEPSRRVARGHVVRGRR